MRVLPAAFALLALLAQGAGAAEDRTVRLTLPAPLAPGQVTFLEVTLGPLASGAEVSVAGPDGQSLGSVSPFALHAGTAAGTYYIPIPPEDYAGGRQITLHLSLDSGGKSRAPTPQEVTSLRLKMGPK